MAHPQIIRARIEGQDFTLYFDYDQLQDHKLSQLLPIGLTPNGTIGSRPIVSLQLVPESEPEQ